jgi:hypothetical protein
MAFSRPRSGRARWRRLRSGTLVAAGALLVTAACSGDDVSEARRRHDDGPVLLMQVRTPLAQADLATLSQESDLVVHGTVEAIETGVRIGPPDLTYSVFTIAVDEVLAGDGAGTVEVAAATRSRGQEIAVEGRPPLPDVDDDATWFLDELAPEFDREGYVMTSPTGLLAMDGDTVAVPQHTDGDEPPPAISEAEALGSEDAVLDHLRSVSG